MRGAFFNPCLGVMRAEDESKGTLLLYATLSSMSTDPSRVTAFWNGIAQLAPERFGSFQRPSDADQLDALSRYVWNMAVSQSLHGTLHMFEVVFRNKVHCALTEIYGPGWYDSPRLLLQGTAVKVLEAKQMIERSGKELSDDRLVAALSFGFWTELYSPRYEPSIGHRTIRAVLPHYVGERFPSRSFLAARLKEIRLLRNRISHFEPIVFDPSLPESYESMHQLMAWMNNDAVVLSKIDESFPRVYGRSWRPF